VSRPLPRPPLRPLALPAGLGAGAAIVVALLGATLVPPQQAFSPPQSAASILALGTGTLAALTAWRQAPSLRDAQAVLALFAAAGALTIIWSLLAFRLARPDWGFSALVLLFIALVAAAAVSGRFSRLAALLLVPALVWAAAAAVLTAGMV
jgi:translocator protein